MLLLIAATNRPWAIDSAMLRGGRFDTQIYLGAPDFEARLFLVEKALNDLPKNDDVDFKKLADALESYGGGDIVSICEKIKLEAYKRAVKTGVAQNITRDDCNKILTSSRNIITKEELNKFEKYRMGILEE
jgi:transitional endoplasmic reticulum ATPase